MIRDEVLTSADILNHWECIAGAFPVKYEKYSLELLTVIVELWIKIRVHSFAKGWTLNFEQKFIKGTRKTLRPDKED